MADEKKKPNPKFTTPRAVFKYPRLDKPDYGSDQFPVPSGQFGTKAIFRLADPAVQALIAKLQPLHDEAVRLGNEAFGLLKKEQQKKLGQLKVNDLFTEILDQTTGEPTGDIEFSFKVKYKSEVKKGKNAGKTWYRYPALFDARGAAMNAYDENGKPTLQAPAIWGGSEGKLTFDTRPYFVNGTGACGLSYTLLAAQIIKRVVGSAGTANDYGFSAEDGYGFDPEETPAEAAAPADGVNSDADF